MCEAIETAKLTLCSLRAILHRFRIPPRTRTSKGPQERLELLNVSRLMSTVSNEVTLSPFRPLPLKSLTLCRGGGYRGEVRIAVISHCHRTKANGSPRGNCELVGSATRPTSPLPLMRSTECRGGAGGEVRIPAISYPAAQIQIPKSFRSRSPFLPFSPSPFLPLSLSGGASAGEAGEGRCGNSVDATPPFSFQEKGSGDEFDTVDF